MYKIFQAFFFLSLSLLPVCKSLHASEFTEFEQHFIDKQNAITYAPNPNYYPYSFINENGEYDGVINDYLKLIQKHSGLQFSVNAQSSSMTDLQAQIDLVDVEMIPLMIPALKKIPSILYTHPFMKISLHLYTHESVKPLSSFSEFKGILGVIKGGQVEGWLKRKYPHFQLQTFTTARHVLQALNTHQIDGMIGEPIVAEHIVTTLKFNDVIRNIAIDDLNRIPITFGLKGDSKKLLSIINKAINNISLLERNRIAQKWISTHSARPKLAGAFGFGRPPYMYDQTSAVGFEYALVQNIFTRMGVQVGDVEQMPTAKGKQILLERNNLVFSAGVPSDNTKNLYYSDAIATYNNIALTRKSDGIELKSMQDLAKHNVASFKGAMTAFGEEYTAVFKKQTGKNYIEFNDQEDSIQHFFTGQSDVLIGDKNILLWMVKFSGLTAINDPKMYSISPLFGHNVDYRIAFKNEVDRDYFNAALAEFKLDSQYTELLNLYKNSDFSLQIKRANFIAKISAYYIFHNDIAGLIKLLRRFELGADLQAISVLDTVSERKLLSMELTNEHFEFTHTLKTAGLQSIQKDSFFEDDGNLSKVGEVKLYFKAQSIDQINNAYVPQIEQFEYLPDNELILIKQAYNDLGLHGQNISLTKKEVDWIKSNPIVKLGIDPTYMPYEGINSKGEYIGLVADYMKEIELLTGLNIEPVMVSSWDETVALFSNKSVELVSAGIENPAFKLDYQPVRPFVTASLAIAMNRETEFIRDIRQLYGKTVAIIDGASNTALLIKRNPQIKWLKVSSTNEGLEHVSTGKADAIIDALYVLNYTINVEEYGTLNIVGKLDNKVNSTFQVLNEKPILRSILDKAIRSISQARKDEIDQRWLKYGYKETLDYQLVWQILAATCIILLAFLFWNRKLVAQVKARQVAEDKLKSSERQLFDMLNTAPIAVALVQNGKAIFTNKTALETFGLTEQSIADFDVRDIYTDLAVRDKAYQLIKETGMVENLEIEFKTAQNSVFTGLTNYYATEHNDEPAVLFWAYDVTALKQLNAQLEVAMQSAEEANRAKSDFLANMSHEIRTPMNAIIGMSHLALEGNLPTKEANYIKKVHRAAGSLLGIINDILDFSKIEAGKLDMETLEFNLDDVFDHLANLIGLKTQEKSIECIFNIAPDVPLYLVGDSLRLGQILLNLGSNAVKFTEQGRITFNVSIDSSANPLHVDDVVLRFSVSDTGIGLSTAQQGKLFKSFSQADSSTTRKYGGTGLGLTICQRLVTLMKGEIGLNSEEGQGCEFFFTAQFSQGEKFDRLRIQEYSLPIRKQLNAFKVGILEYYPATQNTLIDQLDSLGANVQVLPKDTITLAESIQELDAVIINAHLDEATVLACLEQAQSLCLPAVLTCSVEPQQLPVSFREFQNVQTLSTPYLVRDLVPLLMINVQVGGNTAPAFADNSIETDKAQLKGAVVLLVEDNELNQDLALDLLASLDIKTTLAVNGQDAIDQIKSTAFDGVLMDIQMPVMDGITATAKVREFNQALPIIAMTANAMAGDRDTVIAAGMNDYISKPIDFNAMVRTMAKWFTRREDTFVTQEASLNDLIKQEADIGHDFSAFEYINSTAGLKTCNGNQVLYTKLLTKFYQGQQDFDKRFTDSQHENNWEAATRIAHTLKGNAGNIGAMQLSKDAETLEHLCKSYDDEAKRDIVSTHLEHSKAVVLTLDHEKQAELSSVLNCCCKALKNVLSDLKRYIDRGNPKRNNVITLADNQLSDAELITELTTVLLAIQDYNAAAGEMLAKLMPRIPPTHIGEHFTIIIELLDNYDFEKAETTLTIFIDSIP